MSLFPDCRNDDVYNENFLAEMDDQFVYGFDCALDAIINLFANNLDTYEEELTELCPEGYEKEEDEAFATRKDLYEIIENDKEIICAIIKDWLEMERNEVITSCIDGYDDDSYGALKVEALKRHPELKDKLYDTRKFMVTGKKESSEKEEEN